MRICLSTMVASLLCFGALSSSTPLAATTERLMQGKAIAFDRQLGNCLACHAIAGGTLPGNIGPPLVAMKARFPDRRLLRAQIEDPTANNPATVMPPFGKHDILTPEQIDLVTEFVHSL